MTTDPLTRIEEAERIFQKILMRVNRRIIDYVVIVLANLFIFRNFFIQPGLFVQGTDALLWIANANYYEDFKWLYLWYARSSLGYVRQPTLLEDVLGTASAITQNPFWVYRLLMFSIGIVSSLAMYVYILSRTRNRSSAMVGALFYIMNPWFLAEIQHGHLDLLLPLALLPMILQTFDLGQVLTTSIVASLFLSSAHPQAIYLFGIFLIAYFVFTPLTKKRANQLIKIFLISASLSAFYLIPFLFVTRTFGYGGLVGGWTIEDISDFILQPTVALLIFVASMALWLSAWYFRRDYPRVKLFIISSLLATTLAVSPSFTFSSGVYYWIFQNVPLFDIFRVPSRLLMLAVMCNSYLMGVVLSSVKHFKGKKTFKLKKPLILSTSKILSSLIIALMVLVVVFGWLNLSFNPSNYSLPKEWGLDAYYWLGDQKGNWRTATLGGESYWISTPWGDTQEYGTTSTIFTGKPVIGVPSEAATSYLFLKYLEYLVANNVTDQWLKMLGAFNIKYVTLAPYASSSQCYSLLNQEGIRNGSGPAYNSGGANVYNNPYWMPLIYTVPETAYIVGGFGSMTSLQHWPGFEFDRMGYRLVRFGANLPLNESNMFIYEDPEFMDFLMTTYDGGIMIPAYQYGFTNSRDPTKYWISDDTQTIEGKTVFNDFTLTTIGNRSIDLPFSVNESGFYEIWVRMLAGLPNQGSLAIDSFTIRPQWTSPTFKWFKFGQIYLSKGEKNLYLRNSLGENDIDMIVLLRPDDFERHAENVANNLQNYTGKIVFQTNAHDMFLTSPNSAWKVIKAPLFSSDGYVLHSEVGGELKASLYIPKDGKYSFALRTKTKGTITLQIGTNTLQLKPANSTDYEQYFFDPVDLKRNNYTIDLKFEKETDLDAVMLQTMENGSLNGISTNGVSTLASSLSFNEVNPTEYLIYYNNSSPSYMIFSSSYNPSWRLFMNEVEVAPMMMYGSVSGFYINQKSPVILRLMFTEQKYVYPSILISSFTWIAVGILIGTEKIQQKRMKKEHNRLRSSTSTRLTENEKEVNHRILRLPFKKE